MVYVCLLCLIYCVGCKMYEECDIGFDTICRREIDLRDSSAPGSSR